VQNALEEEVVGDGRGAVPDNSMTSVLSPRRRAAPVYQMSQYYRYGELDDCFGKWREFYDCITYGTNFHQEPDQPERKPCMWELKDFKTAQRDWDNVFNSK